MPADHDDFAEFYAASYGRVVALVAAMVGERHQAAAVVTAVVAAAAVTIVVSLPGAGRQPAGRNRPVPGGPSSWSPAPGTWNRGVAAAWPRARRRRQPGRRAFHRDTGRRPAWRCSGEKRVRRPAGRDRAAIARPVHRRGRGSGRRSHVRGDGGGGRSDAGGAAHRCHHRRLRRTASAARRATGIPALAVLHPDEGLAGDSPSPRTPACWRTPPIAGSRPCSWPRARAGPGRRATPGA